MTDNTRATTPPATEDTPVLRTTLKRGALLTAANWQIVLAQFAAESTFNLLLAAPLVCAALLVAVLLGGSPQELFRGDIRDVAAATAEALIAQPIALEAFVVSIATVLLGGWALVLYVKGGSVTVMVTSERVGGQIERTPLRTNAIQRASCSSIQLFLHGCATLFGRYVKLGGLLFTVYILSGVLYVSVVVGGYRLLAQSVSAAGWTALAALSSAVLLAWITLVNLYYLLVQIAIATEDCGVTTGLAHVARFLRRRTRAVGTVFAALLVLFLLATIVSVVATAGLGLIAFVPLAGLAVLPLQVITWFVRGLLFQFLGLTALCAYSSLYRSYLQRATPPAGEMDAA